MSATQETVGGRIDLNQDQPAAGLEHPGRLGQHGRNRHEVAQRKAGHHRVGPGRRKGQPSGVGLHPVGPNAAASRTGQHLSGKVNAHHPGSGPGGQGAQVAGSAAQVNDPVAGANPGRPHRAPPPALVQPQRDQAVQHVVARRNTVEHGAHDGRLVRSVGQHGGLFHRSGAPRELPAGQCESGTRGYGKPFARPSQTWRPWPDHRRC